MRREFAVQSAAQASGLVAADKLSIFTVDPTLGVQILQNLSIIRSSVLRIEDFIVLECVTAEGKFFLMYVHSG